MLQQSVGLDKLAVNIKKQPKPKKATPFFFACVVCLILGYKILCQSCISNNPFSLSCSLADVGVFYVMCGLSTHGSILCDFITLSHTNPCCF